MTKSVLVIGKKAIPVWLAVLALVGIGAGAAAGTILAGKVSGNVPVAVSQALLVGTPTNSAASGITEAVATQQLNDNQTQIAAANRFIGVKSDDNTAFQAAMELATGDWTQINIPIKNASENDLYALLTLDVPAGLEVEVFGVAADSPDVVTDQLINVVRVGANTWKFEVEKGATLTTANSNLHIVVNVDDDTMPGYFNITGTIQQTAI